MSVSGLQLTMKTLEHSAVPQTPTLMHFERPKVVSASLILAPVSVSLHLQRKQASAQSSPFLHVAAKVEKVSVRVSIERFRTILGIVQAYLVRAVGEAMKQDEPKDKKAGAPGAVLSPRIRPADLQPIHEGSSSKRLPPVLNPQQQGRPSSSFASSSLAELGQVVDVVLEVGCRRLSLAVVSDYEDELDLFYFYLKDTEAHANLFRHSTDATVSFRFESLINNLNFLTPERFIEPVYFTLNIRRELPSKRPPLRREKAEEVLLHVGDTPDGSDEEDDLRSSTTPLSSPSSPPVNDEDEEDKLKLELIVLDQVKVSIKRDLIRQLLEVVALSSAPGPTPSPAPAPAPSAPAVSSGATHPVLPTTPQLPVSAAPEQARPQQSHFQYILENQTEAAIYYSQAGTLDMKVLAPGNRTPFSFSNPYLPRFLEFAVEGWSKSPDQYSLDEPGRILIKLAHEQKADIEREVMLGTSFSLPSHPPSFYQ